jgi:hypothetical protein
LRSSSVEKQSFDLELGMHFLGTNEGAQPMRGIFVSDTSLLHHTYEAVKDEARLIQDDPASGELVFSNAGLPLPLLVSAAGCRLLAEGGFASGMFPDATYETHRLCWLPGVTVLFATDGLHEMRNKKEEDLSWGKLAEIWKDCRRKTADEGLDFLFEEVRTFSENGRYHDRHHCAGAKGASKRHRVRRVRVG